MIGDEGRLVFDFALSEDDAPSRRYFADPIDILAANRIENVLPVLRQVEAATYRGLSAAGFIAYEAALAFDTALIAREPIVGLPLVWFGLYEAPSLAPNSPSSRLRERGLGGEGPIRQPGGEGFHTDTPPTAWNASIAAIHESIAAGETYQVNLTRRLRMPIAPDEDIPTLYESLRTAQQGSRYSAYLDIGRFQILSVSPELFFSTEGRRITTRPMKGTAPRGRWPAEDDALARALAGSEKERAENVMIVDLLRSDIGRVARPGSVSVPKLFDVERYPTVWQMTSTVTAELCPDVSLTEVFAALFPCGSVTGAPKVSTMSRIAALEPSPRGVYCGAVGLIKPGGDAVFNVAIRTLVLDREAGVAEYGVGGGITWDSTADAEWRETEAKAAILSQNRAVAAPPFDLLETLRLEDGAYRLRERHLTRLADSAAYFGRTFHRETIEAALDDFAAAHGPGAWRVRLLVALDGTPRVEGVAQDAAWLEREDASEPKPVTVAAEPISRRDVFLFHKTTHRAAYEERRRAAPSEAFDVLLSNEDGEATEFTIGNIVADIGGVLWTPPIDSGLLPGTLRAELLEQGIVLERPLPMHEIRSATRLWLVNAVRGWLRVRLADDLHEPF